MHWLTLFLLFCSIGASKQQSTETSELGPTLNRLINYLQETRDILTSQSLADYIDQNPVHVEDILPFAVVPLKTQSYGFDVFFELTG